MLKEHLRFRGITTYALAKSAGVSYSTLNDLVNGKVDVGNCRVSLIRSLSAALGMSMDEFCRLCEREDRIIPNSYNVDAFLKIHSKTYFIEFKYNDLPVSLRLCKVNSDTSFYIEEIARWETERYIRNARMSNFNISRQEFPHPLNEQK